jgi:hypothetical protein
VRGSGVAVHAFFAVAVACAACGRVPLGEGTLPTAAITLPLADARPMVEEDAPNELDVAAPAAAADALEPTTGAPDVAADAPSDPASDVSDGSLEAGADGETCRKEANRCVDDMHTQWCNPDGTWSSPGYCNYGCERNVCRNSCRPGGTRCFSADEIQTCGDDRKWGAIAVCPTGCAGARCRCPDGGCG